MLPLKLAERHVLSWESSEDLAYVSADFLDKKACCMTEDNLTFWTYSYVLVAFNCWGKKKCTVLRHQTVIINNHTDADTTSTHPAPPASSHQRLSRLKPWASRCWIRLVSGPTMPRSCVVAFRVSVSARDFGDRAFILERFSSPSDTILPATKYLPFPTASSRCGSRKLPLKKSQRVVWIIRMGHHW